MVYLGEQRGVFQKLSLGSETLGMTSEGLGEMFADSCVENVLLMLVGGQAAPSSVRTARTGSMDPHRHKQILLKNQIRQNDDHIGDTLYKQCMYSGKLVKQCMFSGTLCNQYMCSVTLRNNACFQAPLQTVHDLSRPLQPIHARHLYKQCMISAALCNQSMQGTFTNSACFQATSPCLQVAQQVYAFRHPLQKLPDTMNGGLFAIKLRLTVGAHTILRF